MRLRTPAPVVATYDDDDPPLIDPAEAIVRLFEPSASVPLVSVNAPFTVAPAFSTTPALLLIVRLLRTLDEVGSSVPVVVAVEPV